MNITVKMQDVLSFKEAAIDFREKKIPLPGAYKLVKISNSLDKEVEFYQSRFQEILEKYAKKDNDGNYVYSEDGSQIIVQEDKIEECNEELEELLSLEVELDNLDFSIENLGDIECTMEELERIAPFMG